MRDGSLVLRLEIVMSFFFSELRDILIPALLRLELLRDGEIDELAGGHGPGSGRPWNMGVGGIVWAAISDW
jgi:hypothetical protein